MSDHYPDVDGVTDHAYPCCECGSLVAIATDDETGLAELWASDHVRIFCSRCWPHHDDSGTEAP